MNIPSDIRKLAQLLQKYGAPDPEGWARSQINEGIPQLQRFLFLRQAWRNVLEENDVTGSIGKSRVQAPPGRPLRRRRCGA